MLTYDVAIVGAGPVGLTLLLELVKHGLNVVLIDKEEKNTPITTPHQPDSRIRAISPSNLAWLYQLGILQSMDEATLAYYHSMRVWQADGFGELIFHAHEHRLPYLGAMVSEAALKAKLFQSMQDTPWLECFFGRTIKTYKEEKNTLQITLDNSHKLTTRLLIAADGAHSSLRTMAKISHTTKPYPHQALAGLIELEKPHQMTAWQVFKDGHILGILPTNTPTQAAYVWSHPKENIPTNPIHSQLEQLTQYRFGAIKTLSQGHFPLQSGESECFYQGRVVLVGDAVANIHPLAGQGLNLGLAGASILAQLIIKAHKESDDIGNAALLKDYQRRHKLKVKEKLFLMRLLAETLGKTHSNSIEWLKNIGMFCFEKNKFIKDLAVKSVI